MSLEVLDGLRAMPAAHSSTLPRLGVVIVHGAGIWQMDYWKPIVDAIRGCIDADSARTSFGALGVCYSDVINSSAVSALRTTTLAPRQNAFLHALMWDNVLASLVATSPEQLLHKIIGNLNPLNAVATGLALTARPTESVLDALTRTLLGKSLTQLSDQIAETVLPGGMTVATTIQDVCLYLFDGEVAQKVRQTMADGLRDAQQFDEIVLVSHSLGSIVAFDVLNAWTQSTPKISYWFTLGCPLTKVLRLRPGRPNRLKNVNVVHWYNIFDTSDVVATPIGPAFSKPGLNIHDIFVDVGVDPVSSHDYLDNQTTLHLIADAIQTTTA